MYLHADLTSENMLHILRVLNAPVLGAAWTISSSDELLREDGTADSGFLSP